ncbi:MAG: exopolysaccharide biosynthesis polyprenyl glycosylphosphotransferase [Chlamydiales bacterium]|jgi:exopolysaccharide biosynthesis polyprenyl glycosylphosphotransferase
MTVLGTFVRRNFEPLVLSVQVLVDLAVVVVACLTAWWWREGLAPIETATALITYREIFSITAAICLVCFHWFGMYSPIKSLLNVEEFKAVSKSSVSAFFVVHALIVFLRGTTQEAVGSGALYNYLVPLHRAIDLEVNPSQYSRITLVFAFALILVFTTISRFVSFKLIQELHRRGIGNRNVLIVGTGETARRLQRKFLLVPTLGLNFVGFVERDSSKVGSMIERSRVIGAYEDLERLLGQYKVGDVFVALPEENEETVMAIVARLERIGVAYHVVPRFYHLMSYKVRIENLDSIPLIARPERRVSLVSAFVKRGLDIAIALVTLTLGGMFFLVSSILIRRESPGPALFRQTRIGQDGKPFEMVKFRTMHSVDCSDAPAPSDDNDPRVTRVGRFLRRYSLDELPNFLNVLSGEMSVVGPRPEMPFIVDTYGPLDRERLRAKPGVTGLWQISYARTSAIHDYLDYDLYYIENQSVLLDLVIIALTGFAVIKGTGAY